MLEISGLQKRFGKKEVLKGVDVAVRPGELTVILGANGSGKSTLLRCAIRLIEPDAGAVELCGADLLTARGEQLRVARRRAAMVFQQVLLVRRRSALENVMYGALGELSFHRSVSSRLFPRTVKQRAYESLDRVGLPDVAEQRASTLSGGQAQRVAVARALCQRARVILADEPVASLDPRAADSVLSLLADVAKNENLGVITVLHQPDLARRYADRLIGFFEGGIAFDRAPSDITDSEVEALYGADDDDH